VFTHINITLYLVF